MAQICINVPAVPEDQVVEVVVTINGEQQLMNYRVVALPLNDEASTIDQLRQFINGYDAHWELYQIGAAERDHIPVMFRHR